jgi:dihydropteroate synthase
MGVLNVTPDSFSDGGRWLDPAAAVAQGLALAADGADIVDVGGESTRPGSEPVDEAEELRRVVPVIEALAPHVRVSVDTGKPAVAEAAIGAGATLINDVTAGLYDVAAAGGVGWAAYHLRGVPRTMQDAPHYDDVVGEVRGYLVAAAGKAEAAGVPEIWIDPGLGFGKTVGQNYQLIARVTALIDTGYPVLSAASRKSYVGSASGVSEPRKRTIGSTAVSVAQYLSGVRLFRVHDVAAHREALAVASSIASAAAAPAIAAV